MLGHTVKLGATIDGNDPVLIDRIVPVVDVVEITPDRWASFGPGSKPSMSAEVLQVLHSIAQERTLLLHGVGLSIASHNGWNADYVGLLDEVFAAGIPVGWHSEHLSFSSVDGEELGTMVAPPCTDESLALVSARIKTLQDRYPVPCLMEHVVRAFPQTPDEEMSHPEFISALLRSTGCGLLLDVYNLECDEHNFGMDPEELLDALDLSAVKEIHIAGGTTHNGFKLDIHSRVVADSTVCLLKSVLRRTPNVNAVIFELLQEAIPLLGYETIVGELKRLREVISDC